MEPVIFEKELDFDEAIKTLEWLGINAAEYFWTNIHTILVSSFIKDSDFFFHQNVSIFFFDRSVATAFKLEFDGWIQTEIKEGFGEMAIHMIAMMGGQAPDRKRLALAYQIYKNQEADKTPRPEG